SGLRRSPSAAPGLRSRHAANPYTTALAEHPLGAAGGASRTPRRTSLWGGSRAGTQDTSCGSLPAAGSAQGRNRGPRLTAWESPGQEPEVGRASGPLSGLSLSQFQAPCPPGLSTAPEPGDLLTVATWHRGCFLLWPHIHKGGLSRLVGARSRSALP